MSVKIDKHFVVRFDAFGIAITTISAATVNATITVLLFFGPSVRPIVRSFFICAHYCNEQTSHFNFISLVLNA